MPTIGVIGAGAWGTALAQVLSTNGRDVTIWAREPGVADAIGKNHENPHYLPGLPLSKNLKATSNLSEVAKKDILLLATPAQHMRSLLENLKKEIPRTKPLVICAKGIELESGLLLSQVVEEVIPEASIAVLTGPTFAHEVARGLPAAVTIATHDPKLAKKLQEALGVKHFRPYITDDVIGAQLGGAIKNVIAIACGIAYGLKLGENARAALLTRGIAEIARLAVAMGAHRETLLGMSGIGDLTLTCSSMQSRNFSLGAALGEGKNIKDILATRREVTEGVHTAKAALDLANRLGVDMPITEGVNKCLNEGASIKDALDDMLKRPFGHE